MRTPCSGRPSWWLVKVDRGAIDELAADLSLEEAERPELDHDISWFFGVPGIAEFIQEKIDACDVFVGDVTLVGTTPAGKALGQVDGGGVGRSEHPSLGRPITPCFETQRPSFHHRKTPIPPHPHC